MKLIISPAKRMEECDDLFEAGGFPVYLSQAQALCGRLREMTKEELQKLFGANDKITHENFLRYQRMNLTRARTPALLAYIGIQYQYMAPKLFSERQWDYVREHLRILSGLYGILKPDDRVTPYRLEMQAKLSMGEKRDLYAFWGDFLYRELTKGQQPGKETVIVNLASVEYSRAVEPYLAPGVRFVTCVFGTLKDGSVKVKATEAKMARGEMVRFLAEREAKEPQTLKEFDRLGYRYEPERSKPDLFVFVKGKDHIRN
ncbi:MAG: peroxide stress protein YaaA [Lachnospiraceae bacterium]|nr:peroxide stress protein YaaA [Lachnospiraceae bacterium]